jgi:threonylcarbamoyladenosine tRNA methylthiotransferase MtaB
MQTEFFRNITIARSFEDEGFDRVDFEEVADMYVINMFGN